LGEKTLSEEEKKEETAPEQKEEAIPERIPPEKPERIQTPEFMLRTNKDFTKYLDAADCLLTEASFNVSQEGMLLRAMDPSRVAMIELNIPSSTFDEYTVTRDGTLTVNITELLKVLRRAGSDAKIMLQTDPAKERLNIEIQGKHKSTFNVPTLEPTIEEVPTPKVQYSTKIKVVADTLANVIDDVNLVADFVRITSNKEEIRFSGSGDMSEATVTLLDYVKGAKEAKVIRAEDLLDYEPPLETAKATYTLSYLADIVKAGKRIGDIATLEYATDSVCKV